MPNFPTPHGDKLRALLKNPKLPVEDRPRVAQAVEIYNNWIRRLDEVQGTIDETVVAMVALLDEYKKYIAVDLIFDSNNDFLYRQNGQIKLDNSIIEEFIPRIVTQALAEHFQGTDLLFGPTKCFSGLRFESEMRTIRHGGGMTIRSKDQDFAISRKIYIRASHHPDFTEMVQEESYIAYVAAECKTNLDKTMFQEAAATALDIRTAVAGAKYYLLAEWLDMTPISTSTTAIDEIIILRKSRRIPSDMRKEFNTVEGRRRSREYFVNYLDTHPFAPSSFTRFLNHIHRLIAVDPLDEEDVLTRGYF